MVERRETEGRRKINRPRLFTLISRSYGGKKRDRE